MRLPICLAGIFLLCLVFDAGVCAQDDPAKSNGSRSIQEKEGPGKSGNNNSKSPGKSKQQDSKEKKKNVNDERPVISSLQQEVASDALSSYLSSPRRLRLGRVPRMFGDWFGPSIRIDTFSETLAPSGGISSSVDLPQITRVGKIADNNSAIPFDRVFFGFNYFHNGADGAINGPVPSLTARSSSISRYTVGVERTFLDGLGSIETRFVFGDTNDFGHAPVGQGVNGYQAFSPTMGNLSFIGKMLLFENDSTALAAGLALECPTGGDSRVQSGSSIIEVWNNATYVTPYIGLLKKPVDSPWFANAFVQFELPLWGNRVVAFDTASNLVRDFGKLSPQTSVFVDVGVGRWLLDNPGGLVSGVAGFFEAHYNMALNAPDSLDGSVDTGSVSSDFVVNSVGTRFEVADVTAGLHFEFAGRSKLRLGAVIPVTQERTFETEFGFQFTRSR